MIVIHHNFDETAFKWLWAKYVKAGNLHCHCTACILGSYSKKFSGTSNHELKSQPTIIMDEIDEKLYNAIYFCGVLKKGYLNKDPLKNNYRHNVHFAVRPLKGAQDEWNFENWHVKIENGIIVRIPNACELPEKYFTLPYSSHFYTCRIFRWMLGHFYPDSLIDITYGYPNCNVRLESGEMMSLYGLFDKIKNDGFKYARNCFEGEEGLMYLKNLVQVHHLTGSNPYLLSFKNNCFDRKLYSSIILEKAKNSDSIMLLPKQRISIENEGNSLQLSNDYLLWPLFEIGIEDYLDTVATYQERNYIEIQHYRTQTMYQDDH